MEINTVPSFKQYGADSVLYIKIPKLNFPVDETGKAVLVQDLRFYDKNTLYNEFLNWRANKASSDGMFKAKGMIQPEIDSTFSALNIYGLKINATESFFKTFTKDGTFGFSWKNSSFPEGTFPEYYKKEGDEIIPIQASAIPENLGLVEAEFPLQDNEGSYISPESGSWKTPGPSSGPHQVLLNDGSIITYYWYRFIDQPVFCQFNWAEEKKTALQALVEKIHKGWPIDRDYIPAPTTGQLVSIDQNLIVTPPDGLETGFVPIVVKQASISANEQ
jgi:hypothetical protein